jgi:hypothetical protein
MIKYGLISKRDADCIELALLHALLHFPEGMIDTCEVGVYAGTTSKAICEFVASKGRGIRHIGIDSGKDGEKLIDFPEDALLISGNSNEVYNQIPDNSQHFIFIDANHNFPHVISDFFCYESKIRQGGYLAFHDTGSHIQPFVDYQGYGSKDDRDMYISVRRALKKIGLLDDKYEGWKLIFDVSDIDNRAGGICVFKKLI